MMNRELTGEAMEKNLDGVKDTIYEYLFDLADELTYKQLDADEIDGAISGMAERAVDGFRSLCFTLDSLVQRKECLRKMEEFEKEYERFMEIGA